MGKAKDAICPWPQPGLTRPWTPCRMETGQTPPDGCYLPSSQKPTGRGATDPASLQPPSLDTQVPTYPAPTHLPHVCVWFSTVRPAGVHCVVRLFAAFKYIGALFVFCVIKSIKQASAWPGPTRLPGCGRD